MERGSAVVTTSPPLRAGRYRATLTATDAARARSKAKAITFRVVRR